MKFLKKRSFRPLAPMDTIGEVLWFWVPGGREMDADMQLLAFRLGGSACALPLGHVHQVIRSVDVSGSEECPDGVLGLIDFHGEAVPLLDLRWRLGLPRRGIQLDDQFVIVSVGGQQAAVSVDRVTGIVEVPPSQIAAAQATDGVGHAPVDLSLRGDAAERGRIVRLEGDLLLICDIDQLFDRQIVQRAMEMATEPVSDEH